MTEETRTTYHHGHLRTELLNRARQVLDESGVQELSLRQLARDLDVSSAAPRRHFHDKAALMDALALSGYEQLEQLLAQEIRQGDFAGEFGSLTRVYLDFATHHRALLDLMYTRKYGEPAIAQAAARVTHHAMAIIERGQARGEVMAGDAHQVGMACFTAVHGITTLVMAGFVTQDGMHQLLETAVAIVVHGVRPASA